VKKIIIIPLIVVFLALIGGSAYYFKAKPETIPSLDIKEVESKTPKIETADWEDPAGFSFSFDKSFKVDSHPDDEINYSNLTFTKEGDSGVVQITVSDFKYKNLDDWLVKDTQAKLGAGLDTQISGINAKKVAIGNGLLLGLVDSDNVGYFLRLKPGSDETYWQKTFNIILDSFKFIPYEGEAEDSSRLDAVSDENNSDDNAIYEPEEVIE
jgi:hypothetical protein